MIFRWTIFIMYSFSHFGDLHNLETDNALDEFENFMTYELLSILEQENLQNDSKIIVDETINCDKETLEAQFQEKFNVSLKALKENRKIRKFDAFNEFKNALENLTKIVIDDPLNYIYTNEVKQKLEEIKKMCFSAIGYDIKKAEAKEVHIVIPEEIRINYPNYTKMKEALCNSWSSLYFQRNMNIPWNTTSFLDLKLPFVLPGGRFREFYYWDSYWIILGLLHCNQTEMALSTVQNFINVINEIGYIPNGARKYYLNRSLPPYFTLMLKELYDFGTKTNNSAIIQFVQERGIPAAYKEYQWWQNNRRYFDADSGHMLNRYHVETIFPRPESFKEDLKTYIEKLDEEILKRPHVIRDPQAYFNFSINLQREVYSNIKSAAESGWDFSTRWFDSTNSIKSIRTRNIIPADLNAILYKVELVLADFLDLIQDAHADELRRNAHHRKLAINFLLWNSKTEIWSDYDVELRKHVSKRMYFSNIMPLVYGIDYPNMNSEEVMNNFLTVMNQYEGGIPASSYDENAVNDTQQQWDFPNVWPPHQHILVSYLYQCDADKAKEVALKYMRSVYYGFVHKQCFFEKYNCIKLGARGEGGEYLPQVGFGWTNGVALKFMEMFGDEELAKELEK